MYTNEEIERIIYGEQRFNWAERNLPPRYRAATLEQASGPAAEACRQYAEQFAEDTQEGLYLHGPTGTGKTWLAAATAARIAERKVVLPRWLSAQDMARGLRAEVGAEPGAEKPVRDKLRGHLLVLDDLGAERLTDFIAEELTAALCWRYDQCLPIIVTSNWSLAELDERMGARVASRLAEMCRVVLVSGPDRRLEK